MKSLKDTTKIVVMDSEDNIIDTYELSEEKADKTKNVVLSVIEEGAEDSDRDDDLNVIASTSDFYLAYLTKTLIHKLAVETGMSAFHIAMSLITGGIDSEDEEEEVK